MIKWFKMNEEEIKEYKPTLLIFTLLMILSISLFAIIHSVFIVERGSVTGIFVSGYTEDYGDFCGQYPYTRISLRNWTSDGANPFESYYNEFHFFGYHPEVDDLSIGQTYKFSYHKESRSADSDASETIYYYVIDNIEMV